MVHPCFYGGVFVSLLVYANAAAMADQQQYRLDVQRNLEAFRQDHSEVRFQIDPQSGLPISIDNLAAFARLTPTAAAARTPAAPEELSARLHSEAEAADSRARQIVTQFLGSDGILGRILPQSNPMEERVIVELRADPAVPGRRVVTTQQRLKGIDVYGARTKFSVDAASAAAAIESVTPKFSYLGDLDMSPEIGAEAAVQRAWTSLADEIREEAAQSGSKRPTPQLQDLQSTTKLVVWDPTVVGVGTEPPRLAWQVDLDSFRYFVDASTSEIVFSYDNQPQALTRRIFDLQGHNSFPGAKSVDEPSVPLSSMAHNDVKMVFKDFATIYHFYSNHFKRDGIGSGPGTPSADSEAMVGYVRLGKLDNAQWCYRKSLFHSCPGPHVMVFGTGFTSALDITAHEIAHGVIAYESNLDYFYESGAINEALADFFGTAVERANGGGNWVIGEQLPGHSIQQPLRDMHDPRALGFDKSQAWGDGNRGQPDHYQDLVKRSDKMCRSLHGDNGCVHLNSGIINRALNLISEGGSHGGVTVQGIGLDPTTTIIYFTLVERLGQSVRMMELAGDAYAECLDLMNRSMVRQVDCDQVKDGFRAVGLEILTH